MKQVGIKHDEGKAPMGLLDWLWLKAVAAVLAFGAKKYAAHNWRGGIAYSRLYDAALRHIYAFIDGEDNDPESGLSHLAHASCCLMFLYNMTQRRPDLDDRYKPEPHPPYRPEAALYGQVLGAAHDEPHPA